MTQNLVNEADWHYFTFDERAMISGRLSVGNPNIREGVNFNDPLTSLVKAEACERIEKAAASCFAGFESRARKEKEAFLAKGGKIETQEQKDEWYVRERDEAQAFANMSGEEKEKLLQSKLKKEKVKSLKKK